MKNIVQADDNIDAIRGVTLKERAQLVLSTMGRTPAEINRAFRLAAKTHHPDSRAGNDLKFKLINEACQLLLNRYCPQNPLLADDELIFAVAGRRVAPLLNRQKDFEQYNRWHEKQFHDGDWFYPYEPGATRRPRKREVKDRRKRL